MTAYLHHDQADAMVAVARELSVQATAHEAMQLIASAAVSVVGGATCAGITVLKQDHFVTVASTSDLPVAAEALQYTHGGPCTDAILDQSVVVVDELRTDPRWAAFVAAADGLDVLSMLSLRLYLEYDQPMGALNLYAPQAHVFDTSTIHTGELFVAHAALALALAAAQEDATNLRVALDTNRDIGTAIGIVMARYLVTREDAFDLLRKASQHAHRKLREISAEVVDTGTLTFPAQTGLPIPSRPKPRALHATPATHTGSHVRAARSTNES
jgi:hypothetical protein